MAGQLPDREEAVRAIGDTGHLPEPLRLALDPGDDFEPIPAPKRGDWLAEHREPGQSFAEYARIAPPRPDGRRRAIVLQPLGRFELERAPSPEILREFAASFFRLETTVRDPLVLDDASLTTRRNPLTGNRQVLTRDVLDRLLRTAPPEAFCVLALTMEDLYPDPAWNFVFGQASPRDRVGVFSFARYDPAFFGERTKGEDQKVLLRRSCKVLAHEACHLLGLAHCIHFRCLMNGSNHLQESDARPLALCPVCLRKLWLSTGFDVFERYRALLDFFTRAGLESEAEWLGRRLRRIGGGKRFESG